MPLAFLALIGFQLLGEILHRSLRLPLPGAVIGMFMLAAILVLRERRVGGAELHVPHALANAATSLLTHMGLLFVPAGVGVSAQPSLLRHEWLPIVVGVIGSTLLSLVVTGIVLHHISKAMENSALSPVAGVDDREGAK
jgi:holin-like protein